MTVFVSYSRNDKPGLDSILHDLKEFGSQVWVDEQLTGGQEWWEHILETIRGADAFVLVVSHGSLQSEACGSEALYASARAGGTVVRVRT